MLYLPFVGYLFFSLFINVNLCSAQDIHVRLDELDNGTVYTTLYMYDVSTNDIAKVTKRIDYKEHDKSESFPTSSYYYIDGLMHTDLNIHTHSTLWNWFSGIRLSGNQLDLTNKEEEEEEDATIPCTNKKRGYLCAYTHEGQDIVLFSIHHVTYVPPTHQQGKKKKKKPFSVGGLLVDGPIKTHEHDYYLLSHSVRHRYAFTFHKDSFSFTERPSHFLYTSNSQAILFIILCCSVLAFIYCFTVQIDRKGNVWVQQQQNQQVPPTGMMSMMKKGVLLLCACALHLLSGSTLSVLCVLYLCALVYYWRAFFIMPFLLLDMCWSSSVYLAEGHANAFSTFLSCVSFMYLCMYIHCTWRYVFILLSFIFMTFINMYYYLHVAFGFYHIHVSAPLSICSLGIATMTLHYYCQQLILKTMVEKHASASSL